MSSAARKRKTKGASLWSSVLAQGDGPQEFDPGCPGNLSQYFCETCDKDLKTEEQLKQHFSEHIPCAYPGCKFNAHFLVIEKHIRMAHANGIGAISLETEEDIRKWREERKKNYPTKQKIAEKKAEIQLKMIRGEKIDTKKFDMKEKRIEKRKIKEIKKEQAKRKKIATQGLVHYESSSSSSSSEEEEEESDKEEEEPKKCTRTNCKNNCKICTMKKINDNMKAQPEYEVIYNNKLLRSHQTNILKSGKKCRYPVGSYKDKFTGEREMHSLARPTLLEMLLKDEIRKERNQILQALHFIVQNDFFDNK